MSILVALLTIVLFLLSIALIFVVVVQNPKSEGFGSGVQNTPGGSFRGKAGFGPFGMWRSFFVETPKCK